MKSTKRHLYRLAFIAATLILAAGLFSKRGFAHGDATLTVEPTVIAAGGSVRVTGEGVEAGEVFTIHLVGINYQAPLGVVTAGEDEDFHQEFTIPTDAPPGIYQVVAAAEGGELTAELTVVAGDSAIYEVSAEPSAEPMELDRSRSPQEFFLLAAAISLTALLGVLLIRIRA